MNADKQVVDFKQLISDAIRSDPDAVQSDPVDFLVNFLKDKVISQLQSDCPCFIHEGITAFLHNKMGIDYHIITQFWDICNKYHNKDTNYFVEVCIILQTIQSFASETQKDIPDAVITLYELVHELHSYWTTPGLLHKCYDRVILDEYEMFDVLDPCRILEFYNQHNFNQFIKIVIDNCVRCLSQQ